MALIHVTFWFRRVRSGKFNVKYGTPFGRPIVENINKINKFVESDQHVGAISIT